MRSYHAAVGSYHVSEARGCREKPPPARGLPGPPETVPRVGLARTCCLSFQTFFGGWLLLSHFGGCGLECVEKSQVP